MLSDAFKKTIKESLKINYDIDCYRISSVSYYDAKFRGATLHCSHNDKNFTLIMLINVEFGSFEGVTGQFNIFVPEMFTAGIDSINTKINLSLIKDSISEVRRDMSLLLDAHFFQFKHHEISLIKGTYIKNDDFFHIKKIETKIESDSFIKNCTSLYFDEDFCEDCCCVQIIGNEIFVTPTTTFDDSDSIFKKPSTLISSGMDVFKANFVKSVLLHLQIKYKNEEESYKFNVDTIIPLTYQEILQEFLVLKMEEI
jgi:hypothetical protein